VRSVDELREYGQPAQPVGEDMMDDQQQRGIATGHAVDQRGPPQGPVTGERLDHEGNGGVHQGRLVARRPAAHATQMPSHVEGEVIDPHGPAASRRCPRQPLPQTRDTGDALGQHAFGGGRVDRTVQDQDRRELLRHASGVHGEEGQVGVAQPVDRRPRQVHATAHACSMGPRGPVPPGSDGPDGQRPFVSAPRRPITPSFDSGP
jgi:hypothetical protein